jgi:hypothetical protein
MNQPADPFAARVQQLLEVVEQQRDRRCAEILQQAEIEAQQLVQQARQKARVRLHREIQLARRQFSHQLILQQAGQSARQRRLRYRSDRALLDDAWQRLRAALERRWQDAVARRLWVEALTDRARARLVQTGWLVEHPADWPAEERLATARRLLAWLGEEPGFTADPGLRCGIRVRAGDTVVDGSCEGLLRDRAHIEAQLLAALRETGHG